MLSRELVDNLGTILEEDYATVFSSEELTVFANDLAEFFQILTGEHDVEQE